MNLYEIHQNASARGVTRYFDAIFFFGLREIDLSDQQKADLMSFIKTAKAASFTPR
jgi:hypothetical protein